MDSSSQRSHCLPAKARTPSDLAGAQTVHPQWLALIPFQSGNNKGRAVLASNPLGRLSSAGPGGAGSGIAELGFDLLLGFARLPGEDLLGREAEVLHELQDGLEGLFGLGLLGVGDLFVEEFFLS